MNKPLNIDYFDHAYNTTLQNERCAEIALALRWIKEHPDFVEIGAVMPYYGTEGHDCVDPFDGKSTHKCRLSEYDIKDKNVLSISTIEHIGRSDYGNNNVNSHEAIDGLLEIINKSKNYFVTIPIGYNGDLDGYLKAHLSEIKGYGIVRKGDPLWEKVDPVEHLNYSYGSPYHAGNFIFIITNGG